MNGEAVCMKCGMVWGYENVHEGVPFPALENNGHGRSLMRFLSLAQAQGEDLGLRARRIKVIALMEDPPQLRRILSMISHVLGKLGFRGN